MDDKVSKLKSVADLRDSGVLTEAEFQQQKAKILAEPGQQSYGAPPQPYAAPPQPYVAPPQPFRLGDGAPGVQPGNGPVPLDRRNGWLFWAAYLGILFLGTFISMAMYDEAMWGGECYTDSWGWEYCEPDADLMFTANLVNYGSSLAGMVIYIYWSYSMYKEFNTFVQYEVLNPFLAACIPLFNIYAFYTYCDHLNKQAAARGRHGFIDPTVTCCLLFIVGIGLPMYQGKLNEFWDMVAYQQSQH